MPSCAHTHVPYTCSLNLLARQETVLALCYHHHHQLYGATKWPMAGDGQTAAAAVGYRLLPCRLVAEEKHQQQQQREKGEKEQNIKTCSEK